MHRIALDAMGGDGAPRVIVEGALSAVREWPDRFHVSLIGVPGKIEAEFEGRIPDRIDIVPASQIVEAHESPVRSIRRKPDSSIVVGLGLVRGGDADAFISAGSTGAVMAASRLILGMIPGVDRPTVGTVFPTPGSPVLVVDSGANVDTRPAQLLQFAHLGSVYMHDLMGLEAPRIGLLNVGEEPGKGGDRAVATYRLLQEDEDLHFVGNVEGDRIVEGVCDVLVCDGFVGNVLLKFYESIAGFVIRVLESEIDGESGRPGLEELHRAADYQEHGGAPLLGVNGVSVICHGASSSRAIKNAIRVAGTCVESGMVEDLGSVLGPSSRTARVWRRIRRR
ncbi:MAG: phosphate acyltransferase PlsX [Candidatus Palauibacterales bacterium]|nr:phosphate acyltransferase PlsX [Candidatus Palauibacterales bacterium]